MTDFMKSMKSVKDNEKSFTENMAVAYKTTGNELLDFNFRLTELRNSSEDEIVSAFKNVFYADEMTALRYLFYVGDIREGLGERKIFKSCIRWLCTSHMEWVLPTLRLISEYSRWDILVSLIDINKDLVHEEVVRIIENQLASDIANMAADKNISLLAKWMPSENTSSKNTRNLARKVMKSLKLSPKAYRKTLSALRKYIDVVEIKMSANEWTDIDYSKVPSQANLKYECAFNRHDPEGRIEFLQSLKNNNTKINASVLQPHEIINKYSNLYSVKDYNETLEQLWNSLSDISVKDTLVVRDGSGSMTCALNQKTMRGATALDVATALSIYCSEHSSGGFKNKFVTFSCEPEIVDISNANNLHDKLDIVYEYDDCSNTDIEATMELILDTAIKNNMKQEDLPKNILIISDMQFDGSISTKKGWYANGMNWDETIFEEISAKFNAYGYSLPKICFWNLCSRDAKTIPMKNNDLGLILCSGFSVNNMKMFMSGEINPLKILLEIINSSRYDMVENALIKL